MGILGPPSMSEVDLSDCCLLYAPTQTCRFGFPKQFSSKASSTFCVSKPGPDLSTQMIRSLVAVHCCPKPHFLPKWVRTTLRKSQHAYRFGARTSSHRTARRSLTSVLARDSDSSPLVPTMEVDGVFPKRRTSRARPSVSLCDGSS